MLSLEKSSSDPDETINKDLDTGEVEVHTAELTYHNVSETPPFPWMKLRTRLTKIFV